MDAKAVHGKLLWGLLLTATLTCAAPAAFPAPPNSPASHSEAVARLKHTDPAIRAEAVAWLAERGTMTDQPLLLRRLRDENEFVRGYAEQALWLLWMRSGDAAVDKLMAEGIVHMQASRHAEAIAAFSDIIRRKPAFAEGWNKRATAYFLAGDYPRSLKDCDEVLKRNPSHFGALSGYGQIYVRLEQYEKAIAWWRRALKVNPNMEGVAQNIEAVQQLLNEKKARSI
jgi:tetratricopeptide (TPR) repeat protein